MNRRKDLLKFMDERVCIYMRRQAYQPSPWTKDPILQRYRFCNVYREWDTVTEWVARSIRKPYAGHPALWFMLCIARQINWPETLMELMASPYGAWPNVNTWDGSRARAIMLARKKAGQQVYTGAYMLNCNWSPAYTGPRDKPAFTCHLVLQSVWDARAKVERELHDTLEQAHAALLPYHGWGGFMAYEVVSDLRHTRYLEDAPDIHTWAFAGPGAKRGLNRVYGREVKATLKDAQALEEMRAIHAWFAGGNRWRFKPLEMREVEHSLCEFDKYERARLREGTPRALFRGGR